MVKFTLRQCAYFQAVAKHGGIAQAARALNLTQPSVAQALEKLEEATGLVLFERHHAKGLTLTLQGRGFLVHVERLDQQARQVEREAAALCSGAAGEIRLGMFWSLSPFYAPGLALGFAREAPGVSIRLSEQSLTDLAENVRKGELDFAITYDRGGDYTGLALLTLATLRPTVLLAADHPLAKRQSVELSALAGEPYVMFDAPGSRTYFENLLSDHGINPRIAFTSTTLEGVRSAVAAGFGFTILAVHPPSAETYDGRSTRILAIEEDVRSLNIVLASLDGVRTEPLLEAFRKHVSKYFSRGKMPPPGPRANAATSRN